MSLTIAAHNRFWKSMGERFGKRWFDEMGNNPTKAWTDLLDKFVPDDVAEALLRLKDRPEQQRAYIPTHAEFEMLLEKSARSRRSDTTDYQRGFWRAVVIQECSRVAAERGAIADSPAFGRYLACNRDGLGEPLRLLLDELCDMEQRNQGQRTPGIFAHALERSRSIVLVHLKRASVGT